MLLPEQLIAPHLDALPLELSARIQMVAPDTQTLLFRLPARPKLRLRLYALEVNLRWNLAAMADIYLHTDVPGLGDLDNFRVPHRIMTTIVPLFFTIPGSASGSFFARRLSNDTSNDIAVRLAGWYE